MLLLYIFSIILMRFTYDCRKKYEQSHVPFTLRFRKIFSLFMEKHSVMGNKCWNRRCEIHLFAQWIRSFVVFPDKKGKKRKTVEWQKSKIFWSGSLSCETFLSRVWRSICQLLMAFDVKHTWKEVRNKQIKIDFRQKHSSNQIPPTFLFANY